MLICWITDYLLVEILEQTAWLESACSFFLSITHLPPPGTSVNDSHLRNNSSVTMNTCVLLATAINKKNQIIYGRGNLAVWLIRLAGTAYTKRKLLYKVAMPDDQFMFSSSSLFRPRFELWTLAGYNVPEDGHNRWPKHVGGYAVYNTINLHICIWTCWYCCS